MKIHPYTRRRLLITFRPFVLYLSVLAVYLHVLFSQPGFTLDMFLLAWVFGMVTSDLLESMKLVRRMERAERELEKEIKESEHENRIP